mmetsp:Transcript_31483/g.27856  ORF Transcript_31483/g.27856 Transcript_31483/m.27856 type:complete len:93 (-) Transcript_31483:490-768(-)
MVNKLVLLDEKYSEIERENHLLLGKLKNIIKGKNRSVSGVNINNTPNHEQIKSLNFRERKKFLKDITKINRKFLVTLNNVQSDYKFTEDSSK